MPRTSTKCRQKGPKERGSYTSGPVRDRVVKGHLTGKSNRRIAREEGIDRKTVVRILMRTEVKERMIEYRQQLFSLIPKAIDVLDQALSSKDERVRITVATKLMEGLQVMPRGSIEQVGQMAYLASSPTDDDRFRELLMLRNFGLPLPEPLVKLRRPAGAEISAQSKSVGKENNPAISVNAAEKKPARQEVANRPGQE